MTTLKRRSKSFSGLLESSSGQTMPVALQRSMKTHFGSNVSRVRIHSDRAAFQMNRELNSKAFTKGNHIYFNTGEYRPDTKKGQHLLAHELTHTVQQRGKAEVIQRKPKGNKPLDLRPKSRKEALEWTRLAHFFRKQGFRKGIHKIAAANTMIDRALKKIGGGQVGKSFFLGPKFEKPVLVRDGKDWTMAFRNDTDYNCHNFTFHNKRWSKTKELNGITRILKFGKSYWKFFQKKDLAAKKIPIQHIGDHALLLPKWYGTSLALAKLKSDYKPVNKLNPAKYNIAAYFRGPEFTHSAVVKKVVKGKAEMMESKLGNFALFKHPPRAVFPYYGAPIFYEKK